MTSHEAQAGSLLPSELSSDAGQDGVDNRPPKILLTAQEALHYDPKTDSLSATLTFMLSVPAARCGEWQRQYNELNRELRPIEDNLKAWEMEREAVNQDRDRLNGDIASLNDDLEKARVIAHLENKLPQNMIEEFNLGVYHGVVERLVLSRDEMEVQADGYVERYHELSASIENARTQLQERQEAIEERNEKLQELKPLNKFLEKLQPLLNECFSASIPGIWDSPDPFELKSPDQMEITDRPEQA